MNLVDRIQPASHQLMITVVQAITYEITSLFSSFSAGSRVFGSSFLRHHPSSSQQNLFLMLVPELLWDWWHHHGENQGSVPEEIQQRLYLILRNDANIHRWYRLAGVTLNLFLKFFLTQPCSWKRRHCVLHQPGLRTGFSFWSQIRLFPQPLGLMFYFPITINQW